MPCCCWPAKAGADSCPSFAIYEEELKPLLFDVFKETKADADAMVDEYVRMYRELDRSGELPKRVEAHRRAVELAQRKKAKLLEYNVTGQISDADFLSMTAGCNQEIGEAEAAIRELEEQMESSADCKKHIDDIRRTLKDYFYDGKGVACVYAKAGGGRRFMVLRGHKDR